MTTEKISRQLDYAWLAGAIEGEGSLLIGWANRHNGGTGLQIRIKLSNNDPRFIEKASRIFKELKLTFHYRTSKKKDSTHWNLSIVCNGKNSCRKLLSAVMPYLHSKLDQAENMMRLIEYRDSLGYQSGWKSMKRVKGGQLIRDPDWKPLNQNPIINDFIEKCKDLKRNHPEASETKRHANQILEIID